MAFPIRAGNSGPLLGFIPGAGDVGKAVYVGAGPLLAYTAPLHVRGFGAVGDGITDDKAAILAALNAGAAAGVAVTGAGGTYGIAGNLELPANAQLQDITCKQLTPAAAGDVRTLTSGGGNNIRLVRVKVDRNGNGTNGAVDDDAGVYIAGGSGHYFEDVEVYGDDMGSGLAILNASNFDCVRPYVHDIDYSLAADPGDDRVQGIRIGGCSKFRLIDPKVHNLGGNFGAGATTKYSRAIPVGGCSNFQITNPTGWSVDQGVDLTGSDGNRRFSIIGGNFSDCYTWGYKFANSARDGTIVGAVAERCGAAGFVVSGPSSALAVVSSDLRFVGCAAYDTGSNGVWGAITQVAGFRVQNGSGGGADSTRGIRFIGCVAHDRQGVPTMEYGFWNDVPANADGRYNEVDITCVSIGHTVAAFQGLNAARCTVNRNAVQSIPSGAWTSVDWNASGTDLGEMHDPAVNNNTILARRAGFFRASAGVFFAANAVGVRGVRLTQNGVVIPGTTVVGPAATGGNETALSATVSRAMVAGQYFTVEVFQTSGGALNLQTTSEVVVEQVSV